MIKRYLIAFVIVIGVSFATSRCAAQGKNAEINTLVQAYTDLDLFNGSVLVAKQGRIILEKGYGKTAFPNGKFITPDTRFCIASLNKQFTAVLIMQLYEAGKLDLHKPVSTYLSWFRKDVAEQITIHQLLSHTAGLREYTERTDFFTTVSKSKYTHREFIEKFCSEDLQSKPGTAYRYTNTGYYILGTIIEELTGQSYKEVLQRQILDKIGMKNTGMASSNTGVESVPGYDYQLGAYIPVPHIELYSTIFAAGGMYSTVQDLYLWDRALYTNQLMKETSKQILFTPVLAGYAYGFGVAGKFIFHQGAINGFRTIITRVTDEQEVIILLSNNFDIDLNPISNSIYAILHDQPYKQPKQPIALAVGKMIKSAGVKKAVEFFKVQQLNKDSLYNFEEAESGLNTLGYFLSGKTRLKDALAIFKLNTDTFPNSANVFDSYAETLLKANMPKLSLMNYQKVLALDPGNAHAKQQISKLQSAKD